jgi:subfamily B ATP-binding cassette protein MsbA
MLTLAITTGLYPALVDLLTTMLFGAGGDRLPGVSKAAEVLTTLGVSVDVGDLGRGIEKNFFFIFAAVVLTKGLSQAVRFHQMGVVAQRVVQDLRRDLFAGITKQDAHFFGTQGTGLLVSRVISDVSLVERAATYAIPVLFGDALKIAVLGGLCLWQYPKLSLIAVVVFPLAAIPIVRFGKLIKRYAFQGQEALGRLTHRVTETLGGIQIVHSYGGESFEAGRFETENETYFRVMKKSVLVRALQTPVMEFIGVGALILTMAYAQAQVQAGTVRPGEVIAFLLALILLYEPVKAIGRINEIIMPGLAAGERVFEVIDHPPDVISASDAIDVPPMRDAVEFTDVAFRYQDRDFEIRDLNLRLPKGKTIALVGSSGSGKTTVGLLLVRLYDVDEGGITIDGVDIRRMSLESLRSQIAVVSQETYLFDDTIRANIAYARPHASEQDIIAAAKAAYAHDFIQDLPDGYETRSGERGVQLSGGQRQRIAIARAFLRDAPILVLDEATSALDHESELEVQRALDALLENRTALVIAHRLSTVRNADEIVVLKNGKIEERGSHDDLIGSQGLYERLSRADRRHAESMAG